MAEMHNLLLTNWPVAVKVSEAMTKRTWRAVLPGMRAREVARMMQGGALK